MELVEVLKSDHWMNFGPCGISNSYNVSETRREARDNQSADILQTFRRHWICRSGSSKLDITLLTDYLSVLS